MPPEMLNVDGSHGEGGGQVLRSCLSLSILTGKAFSIKNIRARRKRPGLRPQHLSCVRACAAISSGRVTGDSIGSMELVFSPGKIKHGSYRFDIGTAGSTALLFQSLLLPLAHGREASTLELTGGTHVSHSPCFHYLKEVFCPAVSQMGMKVELGIKQWGWFPGGGGCIEALIRPATPRVPFGVKRQGGNKILGISASSMLPEHVRIRQARRVAELLAARGMEIDIRLEDVPGTCPGSVVFLWIYGSGIFGGFTSLGARGKPAEKVGQEAAEQLLRFLDSNSQVDEHLSDQLILPAVLAQGTSLWTTSKITRHFTTNAWVAKQFCAAEIKSYKTGRGNYAVKIKGDPVFRG